MKLELRKVNSFILYLSVFKGVYSECALALFIHNKLPSTTSELSFFSLFFSHRKKIKEKKTLKKKKKKENSFFCYREIFRSRSRWCQPNRFRENQRRRPPPTIIMASAIPAFAWFRPGKSTKKRKRPENLWFDPWERNLKIGKLFFSHSLCSNKELLQAQLTWKTQWRCFITPFLAY